MNSQVFAISSKRMQRKQTCKGSNYMDYAMISILELLWEYADRDGKVNTWRLWRAVDNLEFPDAQVDEVLDGLTRMGSISMTMREEGLEIRLTKFCIEFV